MLLYYVAIFFVLVFPTDSVRWDGVEYRLGTIGGPSLDAWTGSRELIRWLDEYFHGSRKAFLVPRLSIGAELVTSIEFIRNESFSELRTLHLNAGVYPQAKEEARRFAKKYTESFRPTKSSIMMTARWGGTYTDAENWLYSQLETDRNAVFVHNRVLEPWYESPPWTALLKGHRILIVHPFNTSIQTQYYRHHFKGEALWQNQDILPLFKELITRPTYFTLADSVKPHRSWSQTLEATIATLPKCSEFDLAILGAGAYGMPLTRYIYDSCNKTAIYLGGALQLLFGIKGRRWLDRPYFKRFFTNPYWIWPDATKETPPGAQKVESSAYWR